MSFAKSLSLAVLLALPTLASAQEVTTCERWESSARNLAEPWEDNTRTFANGNVRIAVLDTIEPAVGAFHLLVLSPPYNELGDRQCRMISYGGAGFAGIDFTSLTAGYDPTSGLGLDMHIQAFDPAYDDIMPLGLGITINQATGEVKANIYPVD